ncbi:MAG TPA: YihY/virulence factor BrkB family protein [Geminicoccus sp.]|uniref:YihY/virulence factor BrkB family protein n=1 Tax=Geminicoccus sp. TaxID=2024832 RepID=UPI002C9191C1|nr:YihY/virulence factor BrkB family protein [Geminicoccus sp.]HWL67074.1 YihY/virulence factor BrkB family protein [Geminicoccus sp.]
MGQAISMAERQAGRRRRRRNGLMGDEREDVVGPGREPGDAPGHDARSPQEIPPEGWLAVLRRVFWQAISDEIGMAAASCGFYAILALFPVILVAISIYGLFNDQNTAARQLEALQGVLPPSAFELVRDRVQDVATAGRTRLSSSLAVSLAVALWSAMNGVKSIITALNVAYEEREKRSFLRLNLEVLLITLCGILGLVVTLTVIVAVPAALASGWLGPVPALLVRASAFVLLLVFAMLALALIYRFGPSRENAKWRWVTPGSILAAALWLLVSLGFSLYVARFGDYDALYGTLGGVVVAMFWFWISAYALLLGAELNAELELQTRHDTTTDPTAPMGRRGAFVADHVVRS